MNPETIQQLAGITGLPETEASALLEAAGGDLQLASSMFFDDNSSSAVKPASTASAAAAAPSTSSSSGGRVSTLNSVQSTASDKKPQRQTFFTGAGQLVEDNSKPSDAQKMVEEIMKKAAQQGQQRGEEDDEDEDSPLPSKEKKKAAFRGTGYKLGSDEQPSSTIPAPVSSSEDESEAGQTITRVLTFWKDGFTIEDGELMDYNDPKNKALLEMINSGQAPLSLFNLKFGQRADVKVAHRMQEVYVKPKPVLKPFAGSGQRLGSVVPGEAPKAAASSSSAPLVQPSMQVDESRPVTSLQIRLADGTRMVARFNLSHTVADLRKFINSARADSRSFQMHTQFPSKTLENDAQTLEEAGLKNAVIIQKF